MLDFPLNILAERTDVERAAARSKASSTLSRPRGAAELPLHLAAQRPHLRRTPRTPTPRSAVADNDAGLGLVIDALSHSQFWPHMAIFVTEDDAQDGQDHVSAHRTISLVISPYVKRGYVSHVHHSNVSMTKTMELLLGAQPLTSSIAMPPTCATTSLPPRISRRMPPGRAPSRRKSIRRRQRRRIATLRRAAEMSADLDLDWFDAAGANLSRVIALVHAGEALEVSRARTMDAALVALAILLGVAALRYGRRVAARATTSSP